MKHLIFNLLNQYNFEKKNYNIDLLYKAGMENIMDNIEYYHDKPYTCQSVIKELFERGVMKKMKETQLRN